MIFSSLLVLLAVTAVSANKDDTYYVNGTANPNVQDKMYWSQGRNVLEDLDQFDALYVTYHHCAWETPTGDDEDGGGGGDGDDWYLGSVPSFRANVAFSLYGKLKGAREEGCSKKTFINSFHTTQGIESFTNALAVSGLTNLFEYYDGDGNDDGNAYVTSSCYQDEDQEGDGDDYYVNGDKMYGETSYGLGCSADGERTFAIHTYTGGYCDANAINGTVDGLEDLNERLELSKCVPIYESGDYYNAEEDGDEDDSSPLYLLETARTCRVHDGTHSCPDPYGKLKRYEKALLKATGAIATMSWANQYRIYVLSYTMIGVGGILVIAAILMAATSADTGINFCDWGSSSRFDSSDGSPLTKTQSCPANWQPKKLVRARSEDSYWSQLSRNLGWGGESEQKGKSGKKSKKSKSKKRRSRSAKRDKTSSRSMSRDVEDKIDGTCYAETLSKDICGAMDDEVGESQSMEMRIPDDDVDYDPPVEKGSHDAYDTPEGTEEETFHTPESKPSLEESITASVEAVNDMVGFFKKKTSEVFMDEDEEPEDNGDAQVADNDQTESNDSCAVDELADQEASNNNYTVQDEVASKKKQQKKRWLSKLVRSSK